MDDLERERCFYQTLAEIVRRAKERALKEPYDSYVTDIHVAGLEKKKKPLDRKDAIKEYFDDLDQALFEQFLVRLVATFERTAFQRLTNAIGEARKTLKEHYETRHPFARAAQHLVKDAKDFSNLAGIEDLLTSYPRAPSKALGELRGHRNAVSHGSRAGIGDISRYTKLDDVYGVLREILNVIRDNDEPETETDGEAEA